MEMWPSQPHLSVQVRSLSSKGSGFGYKPSLKEVTSLRIQEKKSEDAHPLCSPSVS